jgi:asparagine synthase (glutamine-hydrolysing)
VDFIRSKLAEHLSGRRNWQYALWTILQFQAWRQAERSAVSAPRPSAALSA